MIEIDGPPKAFFGAPDGRQFYYDVYAIGAKTEFECLQAHAQWRMAYEDPTHILVWRARPTLSYEKDDIDEEWFAETGELRARPEARCKPWYKMYCRCVKVPLEAVSSPLLLKEEGGPPQML